MSAKEYLQSLKKLNDLIDQKIEKLDDLKELSTAIGSFDYSKDRVQTSLPGDAKYADKIEQLVDLEQEIDAEVDYFVEQKQKISSQIRKLDSRKEMKVLLKRYVEFETFEKIASDLNCSIRNVFYLHGQGLKDFEQRFLR